MSALKRAAQHVMLFLGLALSLFFAACEKNPSTPNPPGQLGHFEDARWGDYTREGNTFDTGFTRYSNAVSLTLGGQTYPAWTYFSAPKIGTVLVAAYDDSAKKVLVHGVDAKTGAANGPPAEVLLADDGSFRIRFIPRIQLGTGSFSFEIGYKDRPSGN